MLASVHPHTPEPPHYKNHPCSYSLHQPRSLAEQRHKAGTAAPEAHRPCFKSVRAVSRQGLPVPPHTCCCSPAEHRRNSQSGMTIGGRQVLSSISSSSHFRCLQSSSAAAHISYCQEAVKPFTDISFFKSKCCPAMTKARPRPRYY